MGKLIVTGAFLFIVGLVMLSNMSNEKVDGGYAAYVYSNPVMGSKEFKQVITGPGGTGLVWRQDSIVVCVTPYTMTENFDDIRAADQLKMNAEAHLVWRIDPTKVKEFVEQYGAISEVDHTPEAIATDAYNSFVKQPFRTAVRTSIAEYRGLEAPGLTISLSAAQTLPPESLPAVNARYSISSTACRLE